VKHSAIEIRVDGSSVLVTFTNPTSELAQMFGPGLERPVLDKAIQALTNRKPIRSITWNVTPEVKPPPKPPHPKTIEYKRGL
jgi:hypothetical protein